VAADLSATPRPSDEEINFIRDFAPELSAGRELAVELRNARIKEKADLRSAKNA